jgi:hypothetical protein
MPRYYFDSHDDAHFSADDEGVELPSASHASDAAARALAEMAIDVRPGTVQRHLRIEVRDAEHVLLVARLMLEIAQKT